MEGLEFCSFSRGFAMRSPTNVPRFRRTHTKPMYPHERAGYLPLRVSSGSGGRSDQAAVDGDGSTPFAPAGSADARPRV